MDIMRDSQWNFGARKGQVDFPEKGKPEKR